MASQIRWRLGQYLNTQGLIYFMKTLRRPSMFKPHYSVSSISDINFENLRKNGIKYVVFDKDNTLTLPYESHIHEAIEDGMDECRSVYGEDNIAILSNSVGSCDDVGHKDAKNLELLTGISVIRHMNKKPHVYDDIINFFNENNSTTDSSIKNEEVCIIGDRILADIVMGNHYKFLTIHTGVFTTKNENKLVTMTRWLEDKVLKKLPTKEHKFEIDHKYSVVKQPKECEIVGSEGTSLQFL